MIEQGIPQACNPTVPVPLGSVQLAVEGRDILDVVAACQAECYSRRPYVTVLLRHPVRGTTMGVAKVSHGDRWDPERGLEMAYLQAVREMAKRQ